MALIIKLFRLFLALGENKRRFEILLECKVLKIGVSKIDVP